jgi:hypothetical protein
MTGYREVDFSANWFSVEINFNLVRRVKGEHSSFRGLFGFLIWFFGSCTFPRTSSFDCATASGFYFSVIEEGEVQAGSKVEIVSRDPQRVAVVDIVRLYLRQAHDPEILHRAMNVSALPQHWKAELAMRVGHA